MSARWRTAKGVAVWTVATGLGMGVSWVGVRPVLDAAVPDRLVAFPAAAPLSESATPAPRSASPRPSSSTPSPSGSRRPSSSSSATATSRSSA